MIRKILTITLLFSFTMFFIISNNIGSTISYFSDTETSVDNFMKAGLLDFMVDSSGSIDAYVGMEALGGKTIIPVMVPTHGSFPIEYKVRVVKISGNDNFCSQLVASTTAPFSYNGSLLSLTTASTTNMDAWTVDLSLPSGAKGIKQDDICSVDMVYDGWHDGDNGYGYSDEEKVSITLHARMVVLNEFLPNPSPSGEFIELYNNSTSTVDLTGWLVGNSSATLPITSTTTINPNGFLLINVGPNFLDDDHDTVRLISPATIVVDSYSYSGGAGVNKSFARIPDGIGAWVDPIPTPGYSNELLENPLIINIEPEIEIVIITATTTEVIATSTPEVEASTTPIEVASTTPPVIEPVVEPVIEPVVEPVATPVIEPAPVVESAPVVENTQ